MKSSNSVLSSIGKISILCFDITVIFTDEIQKRLAAAIAKRHHFRILVRSTFKIMKTKFFLLRSLHGIEGQTIRVNFRHVIRLLIKIHRQSLQKSCDLQFNYSNNIKAHTTNWRFELSQKSLMAALPLSRRLHFCWLHISSTRCFQCKSPPASC